MPPTNWSLIAEQLKEACPSGSVRQAAVNLLTDVEKIGPLRPDSEGEFRRVYKFLHWNEAERVQRVVSVLLARTQGNSPQSIVRAEAWGYTVAALDEWISHARIFYLVTGILEGTLRARLHARLTDYYATENWPNIPQAVPSAFADRLKKGAERDTALIAVRQVIDDFDAGLIDRESFPQRVEQAMTPAELAFPRGDEFLRENATLMDLLMWFQGKRFWSEATKLSEMFRGPTGTDPAPQFDKLRTVLKRIHEARNDVSHYRPGPDLLFAEPLFAAATLAFWMGEDLQRIYRNIDQRLTTELSILLASLGEEDGDWAGRCDRNKCRDAECTSPPPLDWLLSTAPKDRSELTAVAVSRACRLHRTLI